MPKEYPVVKERLVKYATSKGLKPYLFAQNIFLAPNTFSNKSDISSDKLVNIFKIYPDLNFDWLLTGRGEMLIKSDVKSAEIEALEKELNKEIKEHKETLKELNELKKQLQHKQLQKLVK